MAAVFSLVQEVNVLDSKDEANLALLARPELGITFTKLHCWRLTQYEKCVFVDADTLVSNPKFCSNYNVFDIFSLFYIIFISKIKIKVRIVIKAFNPVLLSILYYNMFRK